MLPSRACAYEKSNTGREGKIRTWTYGGGGIDKCRRAQWKQPDLIFLKFIDAVTWALDFASSATQGFRLVNALLYDGPGNSYQNVLLDNIILLFAVHKART